MISHTFGDIHNSIGQADHVPGDETMSGTGQYDYPFLPYMKICGNTPLMRPILYDSVSLRIKDGLYYLNFVTDFIEIYRERILVSDCFYRSFEENIAFANPNDDGYFEFDQNCSTWQAMDRLTKT